MALVRWDPAREIDGLQSDMNRLFDTFFQGRGAGSAGRQPQQRWVPAMDLTETEHEYVLRADLPGVPSEGVEIEVKDNVLTISGERKSEHEDTGEGFYRMERLFGRFSRSLDLPSGIDVDAVGASFANGVLEVRIPKPEQAKARKVRIESEENGHVIEAQSG